MITGCETWLLLQKCKRRVEPPESIRAILATWTFSNGMITNVMDLAISKYCNFLSPNADVLLSRNNNTFGGKREIGNVHLFWKFVFVKICLTIVQITIWKISMHALMKISLYVFLLFFLTSFCFMKMCEILLYNINISL